MFFNVFTEGLVSVFLAQILTTFDIIDDISNTLCPREFEQGQV